MEKFEDDRIIGEGKYARLVKRFGWEFVERMNITGIVGIVAVTEDNKLILVEEYRPAVGANVVGLPAGLVGDSSSSHNEEIKEAAHRELLEETGYSAKDMCFLCEGPPSPGLTTEIIALYMASGLNKIHQGGGDEYERISVYEIPVNEVHEWLESRRAKGVLIDLRIYTAMYFINK